MAPTTRRWRLWFPARLGPKRKRTVTVNGVKTTVRGHKLELPPSANERLHYRVKAPWVAEWRQAAREAAWAQRIPALGRIRISAVVHRRAIGTADEDNDRSRLKYLVDGLRDAGVIANDTRGYVTYGDVREQRADAGRVGILLVIEELPALRGLSGEDER